MGRRSNASKPEEKSNMPEITNQSPERTDLQPQNANPSPVSAELQPNMSPSKKRMKKQTTIVRRSERIQNSAISARNINQSVIEEITVSESEGEDEPPINEEEKLPEPTEKEKSMEEKIDYIVQLLEAQEKTIETQKSKANEVTCQVSDVRYKSLYFDSQKKIEALADENRQLALKIEALADENHQLALKLENARGKLEGYSDVLDKLKDFILVSNLSKFTDTAFRSEGFSPEAEPEPRITAAETTSKKRQRAGGKK